MVGRVRVAGVTLAVVLTGCGSGGGPNEPPSSTTGPAPTTAATVATTAAPPTSAPAQGAVLAVASAARVDIYTSPVQPEPARTLDNPQPSGAAPGTMYPLRMLVTEDRGDWLRVLLPIRPNGSSGWIRRNAVALEPPHPFRVKVELGEHRITVWEGERVVLQEPVGVGASGRTPTTKGLFFTTEAFDVLPSQRSAYGPHAFALSGFSEVLYSFSGGTGVLGIHGTDDTSGLGRDVSNGCIRMSNSGITQLYQLLPLGTPVEIVA